MDHGKDHHAATHHGKKGQEQADAKHPQHQTEESQAPRSGFQLGQAATGYGNNKASELSSFASPTKDFEDLEAESHSTSGHDHDEGEHDDDKDDHHAKK